MADDKELWFWRRRGRSATTLKFSDDFENSMGSIGQKRQKAAGFYSQATDVGGVIARAAFPSRQIVVGEIFE